jgi:choline-sulfatase
LTVSFTHPHDPYVARRKYWDLYEDCAHLLPEVAAFDYEDHDPHSKRIFDANDWRSFDISEEDIRRARRAYFANISYLDDKIGEILTALEGTRQAENTVILFVSDHGDMLGERGLWFKMSFYEGSARVPLMIAAPEMQPGLIADPVSTIDVCPTLCELAGVDMDAVMPWVTGESLVPLGQGAARLSPVAMEYAAEASYSPLVALRAGPWKYTNCALDPEQLFDLDTDPNERVNLAEASEHRPVLERFRMEAAARWDLERFDAEVRESQARRWVVYEALRQGGYYPWDYQPLRRASERFMRNHMDLNVLEESQRFPRGE